jgi:hypothetical protein
MTWIIWLALFAVFVGIARQPKHRPLRPVAQINSADLALCLRRSAKEGQAS